MSKTSRQFAKFPFMGPRYGVAAVSHVTSEPLLPAKHSTGPPPDPVRPAAAHPSRHMHHFKQYLDYLYNLNDRFGGAIPCLSWCFDTGIRGHLDCKETSATRSYAGIFRAANDQANNRRGMPFLSARAGEVVAAGTSAGAARPGDVQGSMALQKSATGGEKVALVR
jgi:hypothetical protein